MTFDIEKRLAAIEDAIHRLQALADRSEHPLRPVFIANTTDYELTTGGNTPPIGTLGLSWQERVTGCGGAGVDYMTLQDFGRKSPTEPPVDDSFNLDWSQFVGELDWTGVPLLELRGADYSGQPTMRYVNLAPRQWFNWCIGSPGMPLLNYSAWKGNGFYLMDAGTSAYGYETAIVEDPATHKWSVSAAGGQHKVASPVAAFNVAEHDLSDPDTIGGIGFRSVYGPNGEKLVVGFWNQGTGNGAIQWDGAAGNTSLWSIYSPNLSGKCGQVIVRNVVRGSIAQGGGKTTLTLYKVWRTYDKYGNQVYIDAEGSDALDLPAASTTDAGTVKKAATTADIGSLATTETSGASYTNNEQDMLTHLKADVGTIRSKVNDLLAALRTAGSLAT